jgi:hypothetical protein
MFDPKVRNPRYFELLEDVKKFIAQNYVAPSATPAKPFFNRSLPKETIAWSAEPPRRRNTARRVEREESPREQKKLYRDYRRLRSDIAFITAEPFNEVLLSLIDERGLQDPEVYQKAQISRQQFSRISSGQIRTPKKATILAFAIALELNLAETKKLLESAGYALSRHELTDVIVEYCISKEIYDLFDVNTLLVDNNEEPLGSTARD